MLKIEKVSKSYHGHQALSQVSMSVQPGAIFGLLGPNGAGKTTLIRIVNQIIAPDEGQVWFNQEPLQPKHIAQIGYLPEERGLYPKMRVGEQLVYLGQLKGLDKKEAQQRVKKGLEKFDLTAWQNKTIEELSKGMAQKVQFLATTLHQPKLLIFDEPFTGFDPINTNLIKAEIRELRDQGATVIFSTHRMESVEEICDSMALIHQSRKVLEGDIQAVKQRFSEGILRFVTRQPIDQLPPDFEQLNLHTKNGEVVTRLKPKTQQANLPQALHHISERYGLLAFAEELPSLNDIFIKQVEHG